MLFKSFLFGIYLATLVVSALPFPETSYESEIVERIYEELLPRNDLFPTHGTYSKNAAIKFVKNIPLEKLEGFRKGAGTIHSSGGKGAKDGHRLDMQGMTPQGYHNIQIQLNGQNHGKSTVGGLLVKGTWSAERTRKELIHSIMHPGRDKDGNEYLHRQRDHDGTAPSHPNGWPKTNDEARKREPRKKFNPKSKKNRKAARKAAWK